MNSDISSSGRVTVRIPTPAGDEIDVWLYLPEGDGPHPAVVMGHGLAAVKAGGLQPFAERFQGEGFAAIVLDYRQWGSSDGQPRDVVSVPRQREDYRSAIGWAVEHPLIDTRRIFAWGSSFSGIPSVELAATDSRLAGALGQSPLVDGLVAMTMAPRRHSLWLFGLGLRDLLGSLFGRSPRYLAASAGPGERAVFASEEALAGLELTRPREPTHWQNRVAARSVLGLAMHRPVRKAASIRCPILLIVPEADTVAPAGQTLLVAKRAPRAELQRSKGGHYDVYEGGAAFDETLRLEVEFLHRHTQAGTPQ
jgi:dienelactone hydrolase